MSKLIPGKILLFTFLIIGIVGYAQERQVSIDSEGKVISIDKELRVKLGMYPEIEGFKSAKIFQKSDSSYYLEIEYLSDEITYRKRTDFTKPELEVWQQEFESLLLAKNQQVLLNQDGRTYFVASSAVATLGFYGIALPTILELEGFKGPLALYMLTGAAGIILPAAMTKNRPVSISESRFKGWGQTRGIAHGVLFSNIIDINSSTNLRLGMGMVFSLGEAFGASALARNLEMTPGNVAIMNAMGDFGFGYGALTASYLNGFDSPRGYTSALVMGGSIAGSYLGYKLNGDNIYSRGDAYTLRGIGFLGGFTGFAIANIIEPENDNVAATIVAAGGSAGIYYGHQLAKKYNFSIPKSIFNNLGIAAGGLFGLGVAYLTSNEDADNSKYLISAAAVGGIGGFLVMHNTWEPRIHNKNPDVTIDYNFNPFSLIANNREVKANNFMLGNMFNVRIGF